MNEIAVKSPEIVIENPPAAQPDTVGETPRQDLPKEPTVTVATGVSAFSLASIRAKRELLEQGNLNTKNAAELPRESFSENDMLLHWNKYAQRLGDRGMKIVESHLLVGAPKLDGTMILHELPNESSRLEFEREKNELVGYLRGKLHNHDIEVTLVVNEQFTHKHAFTSQDKFNRLNEINPNVELLRRTFDLEF